MPYNPTTGIISGAVGIQDIAKAIGAADGEELRDHANINKWAKYKPVRNSNRGELTEQQRADACYGLSFPTTAPASAPYNLIPYYDGGLNGWGYDKPRGGGSNEWFRLLDFEGYRHGAVAPVRSYTALSSVMYDTQETTPFQAANFIASVDADGLSVELTEIGTILNVGVSGLYFGVALIKGTGLTPTTAVGARTEIATADVPLAKNDVGQYNGRVVSFSKDGISADFDKGKWTVIPFLCAGRIPQCGAWGGSMPSSRVFYPIPYANITELEIKSFRDSFTVTFSGTKTLAIQGSVTIRNNSAEAASFTLSVFYWDSSQSGTPLTRPKLSYERQFDRTVTVPANGTAVIDDLGVSADSRLMSYGVGYVLIGSPWSELKGPYNFLQPNDQI